MNSAVCYYAWNLFNENCELVLKTSVLETDTTLGKYLFVFLLTCLFESLFYFPIGKKQKVSNSKIVEQVLLLNSVTHPLVFFVFPYFLDRQGSDLFTYIWSAELFAFLVEAVLLKVRYRYSWTWALRASGLANLFSWTLGVWLQTINLL